MYTDSAPLPHLFCFCLAKFQPSVKSTFFLFHLCINTTEYIWKNAAMLTALTLDLDPQTSIGFEGLMLKLTLQYFGTWCEELTHWKRPWCWERLKAGREGDDRGWNGWMASPTRWTWVWASSGSWWWTGKPGGLQSMGLQRVRHNWATELNRTELLSTHIFSP